MTEEAKLPTIREAVWPVENGAVRISFPDPISSEDIDAIEAYLALWVKRLRRVAEAAKAEAPAEGGAA